ncbi:MAG TPA: hypothetical protein VF142_08690 [Longimicrobium sp.]
MTDQPETARSAPATPDEVRALRARMELSVDQFAAHLGVGPGEVSGWEAGTLRVPRYEGAWIRHTLAWEARRQAARADGIHDCPWLVERQSAFHAEVERERGRAIRRFNDDVARHTGDCPHCARVREWLETQPPLPPAPQPGGVRGLAARFVAWGQTLPAWLRPAVYGAAVAGVMAVLRAALMLLLRRPTGAVLGELPLVLGVAVCLGALAGATWMLVHRPLRRLGRAAPYVTGVVMTAVCTGVVLVPMALGAGGVNADDVTPVLLATVVGGLILGHSLLRHVDGAADPGTE